MASRCINCGGILEYDIDSGKVKCQHCDSLYDAESFKVKTAAEEYEDLSHYKATIFVCPNCGAEIASTELDSVNYCMYCGSFVTLESQLTQIEKPEWIIPFSKTKEDCKKAYKNFVKGKLYAPSEFKDEKFIDGFRGVYVPFWNFSYEYGPKIMVRGADESRDGNYLVTQHYETTCDASGHIDNAIYDASSTFDDEISLGIAPYHKEKMKKFNTSYMFGFYGDTADLGHTVYDEEADKDVHEALWKAVIKDEKLDDSYPVQDVPKTIASDFNMQKSAALAMLPVWFLTWRAGDRIAYSVMNGDTGELYTEIPVDIVKYLLYSVLTAVPIFFLLNEIVTFSATEILGWAIFLDFIMIMLYVFESDKVVRKVMHTDDRGFLATHEEAKKASDEKVSENYITETCREIKEYIQDEKWYVLLFLCVASLFVLHYVLAAFFIGIVATPLYTIYRLIDNAIILEDYSVWVDVSGALLSIVFAFGILIYDPAPDLPYYLSAVTCMLGVGFTAVCMVNRYNDLLTRPLPRFFSKKGGAL